MLHQVLREHLETFLEEPRARGGEGLPEFVERELREFLSCGVLPRGFARLRCDQCGHELLVAFSCKGRGFCPSCCGRRMADLAGHLADHVLGGLPVRQWVLTLPHRLRYALAWNHELCRAVLGVFLRVEFAGDGFLLAFSSAQRGLRCAVCTQRALASYNEDHPEQPIRIRIGLHTGEVIKEGDKFFGKTVILAARIASHARGEQILVSSLLRQLAEGRDDLRFGKTHELEFKGLSGRHPVSALLLERVRAVPFVALTK